MRYAFLFLLLLSGCVASVCPEQLNLTSDWVLSYDERPDTRGMDRVFDRTVSVDGEVHELLIYDAEGTYFVQYNPVRSFGEVWYGPYSGEPLADLACE